MRAQVDATLSRQIVAIHQASRGTYGAPRIHAELASTGMQCGRKRVARLMRLMRQAGLVGCHRCRPFHTTPRDPHVTSAPDLVQRPFAASAPDTLWITDIHCRTLGQLRDNGLRGALHQQVDVDAATGEMRADWSVPTPQLRVCR